MPHPATEAYKRLCQIAPADYKSDAVTDGIFGVLEASLTFLQDFGRPKLNCDDPDKQYFCFETGTKKSRPINFRLFDDETAVALAKQVLSCNFTGIPREALAKTLYTLAISYCAVADILSNNSDKKTPGTYFEVLIGHLAGRQFGINPVKGLEVQSMDIGATLPTDFTFDWGPGKNKIHMPVKTSTRERVIQVWAHQRVLDGVFGVGRFKGVLVCLSETNAKPGYGMTEVCLPGQWAIYQMFIAQLHRVYYFDVPRKYAALAAAYPFIQVKPFTEFFFESEKLASAAPFS